MICDNRLGMIGEQGEVSDISFDSALLTYCFTRTADHLPFVRRQPDIGVFEGGKRVGGRRRQRLPKGRLSMWRQTRKPFIY